MLIADLAEKGVVLGGIFYDIGCRVEGAVHRWACQQGHLPDSVFEGLQEQMVMVPPFHASMHNSECRSKHTLACERFPGWLRPLGEPAEQLWAALGAGPRLKFFTKHHLKTYLENQFALLNQECDERLANELVLRIQSLTRLLTALRVEVALFSDCGTSGGATDPQVCCSRPSWGWDFFFLFSGQISRITLALWHE
jgi:hypothetical protein